MKKEEEKEARDEREAQEGHLLLGVGIVGDVDEIVNFRGENLFNLEEKLRGGKYGFIMKNSAAEIWINPPDLSSDEHGGDAQQLQLRLEEEAALAGQVPGDRDICDIPLEGQVP